MPQAQGCPPELAILFPGLQPLAGCSRGPLAGCSRGPWQVHRRPGLAALPQLIVLGLLEALEGVHGKGHPSLPAAALGGRLAIVDPAQGGEVDGFGAVEAVVEARVVAIGEGDHELAGLLSDTLARNAVLPQHTG